MRPCESWPPPAPAGPAKGAVSCLCPELWVKTQSPIKPQSPSLSHERFPAGAGITYRVITINIGPGLVISLGCRVQTGSDGLFLHPGHAESPQKKQILVQIKAHNESINDIHQSSELCFNKLGKFHRTFLSLKNAALPLLFHFKMTFFFTYSHLRSTFIRRRLILWRISPGTVPGTSTTSFVPHHNVRGMCSLPKLQVGKPRLRQVTGWSRTHRASSCPGRLPPFLRTPAYSLCGDATPASLQPGPAPPWALHPPPPGSVYSLTE